jgi:conjugative transfer region protein TrbK
VKAPTLALAIAAAVLVPRFASAQSVDQLLGDRALLSAELERCKQLGMASVDDARCKTARQAENKRFFGSGATYTPSPPVDVFPSHPTIDLQPMKQKTPSKSDPPPHG